jgi:integrase-like protein
MRIRDHPTAPRSPWQNGHVERLIGSIRRESLDHLVVFDEAQLRRVLKNYASYYNQVRTHLSLDKNAPDFRHPQKLGPIASISILRPGEAEAAGGSGLPDRRNGRPHRRAVATSCAAGAHQSAHQLDVGDKLAQLRLHVNRPSVSTPSNSRPPNLYSPSRISH